MSSCGTSEDDPAKVLCRPSEARKNPPRGTAISSTKLDFILGRSSRHQATIGLHIRSPTADALDRSATTGTETADPRNFRKVSPQQPDNGGPIMDLSWSQSPRFLRCNSADWSKPAPASRSCADCCHADQASTYSKYDIPGAPAMMIPVPQRERARKTTQVKTSRRVLRPISSPHRRRRRR